MKDVKITVMTRVEHHDLIEKYENSIEHACEMEIGKVYISHNAQKPDNFCNEAWTCMEKFVEELANGGGDFYGGWMKDPHSAMISCNDGFRPVSFLLNTLK